MTALLTDEEIVAESIIFSVNMRETVNAEEPTRMQAFEVGVSARSFSDGARFARSIYEARLAEDAKREALWRQLLNHLDEQVIDKLDADGSCYLCKELRAALGLEGA